MAVTYRLEMIGITKSFGGVRALHDVSFRVKRGEIHALVGENGAGKSTLMKILSGVFASDAGEIRIDGKIAHLTSPRVGRELGIATIYQEFALAPDLTVAENIYLDHIGFRMGVINWPRLYAKATELIARLGFEINPRSVVADLSIAYQQVVEIAKALSENARILILDEPTAVLAPQEVSSLFAILRTLRAKGVSIIYISHRLEEIFQIADAVTVVKDGRITGQVNPGEVTRDLVIQMMIGRTLPTLFPGRSATIGGTLFAVEGLRRGDKVNDVSFSVRAGEILGLAGLVGAGRTETLRAIFGADQRDGGTMTMDGKPLAIHSPRDAVRSGIAFVPEDRKSQGAILSLSVRNNITMPFLRRVVNFLGIFRGQRERVIVQELIGRLSIKTHSMENAVGNLSGGNQQKVVLAKWLGTDCRVLLLDEPTRGVDVGAKVEIYTIINELASRGLGLVLASSEMMEIIGMCDRVAVMSAGRIQAVLGKEAMSEEAILRAAISRQQGCDIRRVL